jgi:hypothetical protein
MVKTSAAAGAGLWVAPSVLTFDRVAAAVGSCGTKPVQVDFSTWAGNLVPQVPSSFFAADGTEVWMSIDDSDGVQDSYWQMRAHPGTFNTLDNPAVTGMTRARRGDGVTVTFTFSNAVMPNFWLADVDALAGNRSGWQDYVSVHGTLNGGAPIDPVFSNVGSDMTNISATTVRGENWSVDENSNAEVDFETPIDTLVIRHYDDSKRRGFQYIGIHDFHWC